MIGLRRVVGDSMAPEYPHGKLVVGIRGLTVREGDVVLLRHGGKEKIKRIKNMTIDKVYIEGDNKHRSTDSRHFGWIDRRLIRSKIVWPRNSIV